MLDCCYCTSKTRKSESNSQPWGISRVPWRVVIALVKLENLKAIHNRAAMRLKTSFVVIALVKLENLKAIHNSNAARLYPLKVVIALVKLENLKAIHNKVGYLC